MSLHGTYDDQNIFAKILRGEAPCVKVYEDEHVLSFMDIFPQSKGHTLVIPKRAEARKEQEAKNKAKADAKAAEKKAAEEAAKAEAAAAEENAE